ncbi:MAG: hypothetical protein NDI75_15035 [Candidatus Didemnitutus sp.]|nr:hypothetical protein [Candidatus Didemnitutus sp.]
MSTLERKVLFGAFALCVMFSLAGCKSTPAPPPASDVASAGRLSEATHEQQSKAAAAVQAASTANEQNPDGNPKEAVRGELSVASANLPEPSDKDRVDALARANLALSGKLSDAEAKWAAARDEAAALRSRIAELEQQVKREREEAARELQRQLQAARDEAQREAEARERLVLTLIFFGTGALLLVGGVACGVLSAQIPMLGPRAATAIGAAGGLLICVGMLIRFVERLMDRHPGLFWGGIVGAVALVAIALSLIYANHRHAKPSSP